MTTSQNLTCENHTSAKIIFGLAMMLLTLLPANLRAQSATLPKQKVVCFGDSITKRGYPQALQKLQNVDVINAGVAGNSTSQALKRMSKDVLDNDPDLVVILFGTNDLRVDAPKVHVDVEQYRANLKKMIDNCQLHKAKVVLCTLPPINEEEFFTRHDKQIYDDAGGLDNLIKDYQSAAAQVAKANEVPLVDLTELLKKEPKWISKDGVHPASQGNQIIAEHIAKTVNATSRVESAERASPATATEEKLAELNEPKATPEPLASNKPSGDKKTSTAKRRAKTTSSGPFVHPGIAHTAADLDFVKRKIDADEKPWRDAFAKLQRSRYAKLSWKADPRTHVERGIRNSPNIGASDFIGDGRSAYTHSLLWVLTDDESHALKAAEILNAWSSKLETVSNHDAQLLVGMAGQLYCNAAEILKHRWDGWSDKDQQQFRNMLTKVFYPVIEDFYPSANGNWDASMLQTMIAMGIFLDDRAMFDRAVNYYRSGEGNGSIRNYFNEFGECQESGRDQGHTQMGLEFLANTCEFAWNQGVDLYGEADNRLLLGFEYTARYNLGYDVPYKPYRSFEKRYYYKRISDDDRGDLRPMFEKVVNHYHGRKSLDAPFSLRAVAATRPESVGEAMLPWGTLMYGKPLPEIEPLDEKPTFTPPKRSKKRRRSRRKTSDQ